MLPLRWDEYKCFYLLYFQRVLAFLLYYYGLFLRGIYDDTRHVITLASSELDVLAAIQVYCMQLRGPRLIILFRRYVSTMQRQNVVSVRTPILNAFSHFWFFKVAKRCAWIRFLSPWRFIVSMSITVTSLVVSMTLLSTILHGYCTGLPGCEDCAKEAAEG